MEFGAVFSLVDTHHTGGKFIVMVVHPTGDNRSPRSVLLLNAWPYTPPDYLPGMVANWSVYDTDWERLDDD
jgi:hypothetical protein